MTDLNASRPSLTQLYRRFAGRAAKLPDACDLVSGQVPESAQISPLHADLQRFTRDLQPLSAQLGADLASAFEKASTIPAPSIAHRPMATPRRASHAGSRRWRAVAALAASFVAVVAVWTTQHGNSPAPGQHATAAAAAPASDRIFAGSIDDAMASKGARDEIFRGEFHSDSRSDEIFNSSRAHDG